MRYKIAEGSDGHECCFKYSIIDSVAMERRSVVYDGDDAELVCSALNLYDSGIYQCEYITEGD